MLTVPGFTRVHRFSSYLSKDRPGMISTGAVRLSINLFVGAGVPDGPHANVANSPKTIGKRRVYRWGVEDAAPYDL